MDGRVWWAAVYGITQSPTRLKQLSSSPAAAACQELVLCSLLQDCRIGTKHYFCTKHYAEA